MNLKPLVNDKNLYGDFLEYIQGSLVEVHKNMEQASSAEELYRLQGSARTLRRLMKLREYVNG